MKTETKAIISKTKAFCLALAACLAICIESIPASAADGMAVPTMPPAPQATAAIASPTMPTMPSVPTPPAPAAAPAAAPMPAPVVEPTTVAAEMPPVEGAAPPSEAANDKKTDKNLKSLENKVTDGAKDVARRLGSSATDLTLDDLNAARVTVAKIDALIEIEKHLVELDRVRSERSKESGAFAQASIPQIPGTAFAAPSFPTPSAVHEASIVDDQSFAAPVSGVVINRISGVDGHYIANISVTGGPSKSVHVGDKIPGGGVVTNITSKTVEIQQSGTLHEYQIKGVDKVYGRTL